MVTAHCNGKYIAWNVSHFKVIDSEFEGEESGDEEDDNDLESSPNSNLTSNALDANQNPQNNMRCSARNWRWVDCFGQTVYGQLFVFCFGLPIFSQSKGEL